MKRIQKILSLVIAVLFFAIVYQNYGLLAMGTLLFLALLIPKKYYNGDYALVVTPDLTAISAALNSFGGKIIREGLNDWKAPEDAIVYKNVQTPIALPKFSVQGQPKPYKTERESSGNDVKAKDRTLTVHQSKWDFPDIDNEKFRNTYLAKAGSEFNPNEMTFWKFVGREAVRKYFAYINDITTMYGVYDANGTGAVDIATGWGSLLIAAIALPDDDLEVVSTGAITAGNAVTKVELLAEGVPQWMRTDGFRVLCSWATFDKYKKHYRTINTYGFKPREDGKYWIDGINAYLQPRSYITGDELMATVADNLAIGTDGENARIHATPELNYIKMRILLPIGFQISDMAAIVVNDQISAPASS